MRRLKEAIRNSFNRGSQTFATVEHYANGYATVRLAGSGSRLTNLPCPKALLSGETVIVDHSAEGAPIARPYILPPEVKAATPLQTVKVVKDDVTEDPTVLWQNDEFISVRYTRTSNLVIPLEWNNPGNPLYPWWYASPVNFNSTVWATHDCWSNDPNYPGSFMSPIEGRYFVRATVAFGEMYGGLEAKINIGVTASNSAGAATKHTRFDQYGTLVLTASQIVSLGAGSTIYISARARTPCRLGETVQPYITLPYDPAGTYPILEVALLCPYGTSPSAIPWWWNI